MMESYENTFSIMGLGISPLSRSNPESVVYTRGNQKIDQRLADVGSSFLQGILIYK
jgi:hypothetical protein